MRYKNAADLEQERMERLGDKISAARKRGVCSHGWLQGPPGPVGKPTSVVTCHDCGAVFPDFETAYAANRKVIDGL